MWGVEPQPNSWACNRSSFAETVLDTAPKDNADRSSSVSLTYYLKVLDKLCGNI